MAGVLPRTRFLAGTKTKTGKLRHKSPTSKTMIKAILRNGRLLASVDHRSAWMRRYRDLMSAGAGARSPAKPRGCVGARPN